MNALLHHPPVVTADDSTAPRDIDAVLSDLNFDALMEWSADAASLWRSAEEAAFRGDMVAFAVHLRQVRLVTYTVAQTVEEALAPRAETGDRAA